MDKNEYIQKVFESISENTLQYWINTLKTIREHEVGVIKASGKVISSKNIETFCNEVACLSECGFYLPVVLGGGVQYDALMAEHKSKKVKGIRITPKGLMEKIEETALSNQKSMILELEKKKVACELISKDCITAKPYGVILDEKGKIIDAGFAGEVMAINTKPIISAIIQKKVPVITHLGTGFGNNDETITYNVNATTVAKELVKYLQAKKLILVGDTPIYDKNKTIIDTISSEHDFNKLVFEGAVSAGMILNGKEAYSLLNYLGPGHSVQIACLKNNNLDGCKKNGNEKITSTGLLEELLGNGSGTELKIPFIISSYPMGCINKDELIKIMNGAFGRHNKTVIDSYFEFIKDKDATVYLESSKRGGAVTYPFEDCEYLCKLFTHKGYEGIGIASNVIEHILMQKKKLVWRGALGSEENLEIYKKIIKKYGGFTEMMDKYNVFGIGIPKDDQFIIAKKVEDIPSTIQYK